MQLIRGRPPSKTQPSFQRFCKKTDNSIGVSGHSCLGCLGSRSSRSSCDTKMYVIGLAAFQIRPDWQCLSTPCASSQTLILGRRLPLQVQRCEQESQERVSQTLGKTLAAPCLLSHASATAIPGSNQLFLHVKDRCLRQAEGVVCEISVLLPSVTQSWKIAERRTDSRHRDV